MSPKIISMNEKLACCQTAYRDTRLIHIVDILSQDGWVVQLSPYNCEPFYHLFIDVMSLPLERLECPRLQIRMTLIEILGPILVGRFDPVVCSRDLEGG